MKKRIWIASVLVALLMLISSQVVLFYTVKSALTPHPGDADAGDIWISELNVESAISSFDYVGIGHVNATDDWVCWEDGRGNVTASWTVGTGINHPEYWIRIALLVYNIDDDNKEIGNDSVQITRAENSGGESFGTLCVPLVFTPQQMAEYSQTLVCYLEIWVTLNNTREAVNFTSFADDRCVVAVEFPSPTIAPPFSAYTKEANEKLPSMWSWTEGWDEERRFDDEDDMLNNQTFFEVSQSQYSTPACNAPWYLGTMKVKMGNTRMRWNGYDVTQQTKDWEENPFGKVIGKVFMNYSVTGNTDRGWAKFRFRLRFQFGLLGDWAGPTFGKNWNPTKPTQDRFGGYINVFDDDEDGDIEIWGPSWVRGPKFFFYNPLILYGYKIIIVEDGGNTGGENEETTYWEEDCAYRNNSYDVNASSLAIFGINYVEADIYEILQSESSNELAYTFSGDSGDTRVEFVCEG